MTVTQMLAALTALAWLVCLVGAAWEIVKQDRKWTRAVREANLRKMDTRGHRLTGRPYQWD